MLNHQVMKRFILPTALLIACLATSCNTTRKLYEAKEYDQVIINNAPKICAGHIQYKNLDYVARSYHEANQADHERIKALKATGNPDIWPEIFERYSSMQGRSDALACFPNKLKKSMNYTPLKLDDELKGAKNKAEAYLEAKINQTLNANNPDLDGADKLIRDLERVNADNKQLDNLKLKSMAKRYGGIDKLMHVNVTKREVGPNRDESVTFKETNGKLTATVTDHTLSKTATIQGKVQFIDPKSKRLLHSMPFKVSSEFEHSYSTVEGSTEACSAQTLEGLKKKPVPFPTDESLLKDAEKKVVDMIHEIIK